MFQRLKKIFAFKGRLTSTDIAMEKALIAEGKRKLSELEELDQRIRNIQSSTKTSFSFFAPVHNYCRTRYSWYYNWHVKPYATKVHTGALLTLLLTGMSLSYISLFGIPQFARAASFTSYQTGDWSDQCTWIATCDGGVPGNSDNVTISVGHTVTIATSNPVNIGVGTITVNGALILNDSVTAGDVTVAASKSITTNGNAMTVANLTNAGTITAGASDISISGNFNNTGTFTANTSTLTFTATTTGKTIVTSGQTLNNVTFNGTNGGWFFADTATIGGDLTVTAGTLSGTHNITVNGGDITGDGTIAMTAGTIQLNGSGNFGGATDWTFANLTFGDGNTNTTTKTGSNKITTTAKLNIATNQNLQAGSSTWTLENDGIGSLNNIKQIDTGSGHACALKSDGTVVCWGRDTAGQLGDNVATSKNRLTPVVVKDVGGSGSLSSVASISVGSLHSCALKNDGTVVCWGTNSYGQLGDASTTQRSAPVVVKDVGGAGTLSSVSAIDASGFHTCALKTDQTMVCWGYNASGEIGDNTSGTNRTSPVAVVDVGGTGTLSLISQISSGENHTCAMKTDGTVVCWGQNTYGQLGLATTGGTHLAPEVVKDVGGSGTLSSVAAISAGGFPYGGAHTCALKTDQTMVCWGYNASGQIGDNTSGTNRTSPVVVKDVGGSGTLSSVIAMEAGGYNTCALKSDFTMVCWGSGGNGSIGDNGVTQRNAPTVVKDIAGTGTLSEVSSISVGASHNCALKSDGTMVCWGLNDYGQMGDNTYGTNRKLPVVVKDVITSGESNLSSITSISAGGDFACAIKSDQTVLCWGDKQYGQVGNNTKGTDNVYDPSLVKDVGGTGILSNVVAITTSAVHACALKSDGTVVCWGDNSSGQLGDNSVTERDAPVVVKDVAGTGTLSSIIDIKAGGDSVNYPHTCALKSDQTVLCWGYNAQGQLGNNSTTNSRLPVVVKDVGGTGTLSSVASITTGVMHSCAAKVDQTVVCWGYNAFGQIGDNTSGVNRLAPTVVTDVGGSGTLSSVSSISAGFNHTCAVKVDQTAVCWGYNSQGELGDNSVTTRLAPVVVNDVGGGGSLSSIRSIDAGGQSSTMIHTCALKTDGSVVCFGDNSKGQIGDATTGTDRKTPVVVKDVGGSGSLSSVSAIEAGGTFSCALKSDQTVVCWGSDANGQIGSYLAGADQLSPLNAVSLSGSPLVVAGTLTTQSSTFEYKNSVDPVVGSSSLYNFVIPGLSYNNLTINQSGRIYTALSNFTTNDFTITAGQVEVSGSTATFSGNYSNSGAIYYGSVSTATFNKGSGTQTLASGGTGLGKSFNNLTHSGAGTLQLTSAIDVNGNITNSDGVLDANGQNINIAKDWNISGGSFSAGSTPGAQTVTFDTTSAATISGSTTFNNLTMDASVEGAKTISFASGTTQTISSGKTWTLSGASGKVLTLARSGGAGSDTWLFNISAGFTSGSYINVANSASANANQITAGTNVTDSGNNPGWIMITSDTISGSLYDAIGGAKITSAAKTINCSVNGGAVTTAETSNGDFTVAASAYLAESDIVTIYVDGETEKASTVFKVSATGNLTGINLYQNYTTLRNEGSIANIVNTDLATADNLADTDELFSVDGSNIATYTQGLYIPGTKTYAPGADILIGGSYMNAGTFTAGTYTITMNATSTGKTFTGNGNTYSNITFNGAGGEWTLQDNLVAANMTATAGTLNVGTARTITVANTLAINGGTITGTAQAVTITANTINHTTGSITTTTSGGIYLKSTATPDAFVLGTIASAGLVRIGSSTINTTPNTVTINGNITSGGDIDVYSNSNITQNANITGSGGTGPVYIYLDADNVGSVATFTHTSGTITSNTPRILFPSGATTAFTLAGLAVSGGDIYVGTNGSNSPASLNITDTVTSNGTLSFSSKNDIIQNANITSTTNNINFWPDIDNSGGTVTFTRISGTNTPESLTHYVDINFQTSATASLNLAGIDVDGNFYVGTTSTVAPVSVNITGQVSTHGSIIRSQSDIVQDANVIAASPHTAFYLLDVDNSGGDITFTNNSGVTTADSTRIAFPAASTANLIFTGLTVSSNVEIGSDAPASVNINGPIISNGGYVFIHARNNINQSASISANSGASNIRLYPNESLGSYKAYVSENSTVTCAGYYVAGDLVINSGKVLNSNATLLSVTGAFDNLGTLQLKGTENLTLLPKDTDSGTVEYVGTNSTMNYGSLYYNLTFNNGSTTWTAGGDITVNNNLLLAAGTFNGSNRTITVGGDWNKASGAFTAETSTVAMSGNALAHVYGDNAFNNFTFDSSTSTAGKAVNFASGTTQTISGIFTLTGASGKILTLNRDGGSGSDTWNFNVSSPFTSGQYITVANSGSANSNKITPGNYANVIDGGNNPGWDFVHTYPDVTFVTSPAVPNGSNSWFTGSAPSITLSAESVGPAVTGIYYKWDSGSYAAYTEPLTANQGSHTLYAYATDEANNTGIASPNQTIIKYDNVNPVVDIYADPASANGNDGWYKGSAPVITLGATDASSGVATIMYKWDSEAYTSYSQPLTPDQGTHTISYYSTDNAGNSTVSTPITREFKVDVDAPEVASAVSQHQPEADPPLAEAWYDSAPTVTLSATDTVSDVAEIFYKWNTGVYAPYTTPLTPNENINTLYYYATDNAGNEGTPQTLTLKVDTTAPTMSGITPQSINPTKDLAVAFSWTAGNDNGGSGVDHYLVTIGSTAGGSDIIKDASNNSNLPSFTQTFETPGTYYIRLKAVDVVGLTSEYSNEGSVLIDTVNPLITIDNLIENQYITTKTFNIEGSSSDPITGLAKVEVQIDNGSWREAVINNQVTKRSVIPSVAEGSYDSSTTTNLAKDSSTLVGMTNRAHAADSLRTWSFAWANYSDGSHIITARALDNAGNELAKTVYPVVVDTVLPSVPADFRLFNLSNPDKEIYSAYLDFAGSTDATSGVKNYEVYRGGAKIADINTTKNSSNLNYTGNENQAYYFVDTTLTDGIVQDDARSYTIKAIDNAGNTNETEKLTLVTTSDVAIGANTLVGLKATASEIVTKDKTSANITFTTAYPCIVEGEYGLTTDYGTKLEGATYLNQGHNIILSNLMPNTTYHAKLKLTDIYGRASSSDDISFTTKQIKEEKTLLEIIIDAIKEAFGWGEKAQAADNNQSPSNNNPPSHKATEGHSQLITNNQNTNYQTGNLKLIDLSFPIKGLYQNILIYPNGTTVKRSSGTGEYSILDLNNKAGKISDNLYLDSELDKGISYRYLDSANQSLTPITMKPSVGDDSALAVTNIKKLDDTLVIGKDKASLTIFWQTNRGGSSQVEYGQTTSYGQKTTEDTSLNQGHNVTLDDLIPGNTYHVKVISKDINGNIAVGNDITFDIPKEEKEKTVIDILLDAFQKTVDMIMFWD